MVHLGQLGSALQSAGLTRHCPPPKVNACEGHACRLVALLAGALGEEPLELQEGARARGVPTVPEALAQGASPAGVLLRGIWRTLGGLGLHVQRQRRHGSRPGLWQPGCLQPLPVSLGGLGCLAKLAQHDLGVGMHVQAALGL